MAQKYSFLVIKYPQANTAMDALKTLKQLSNDNVVKLRDAVAITKTPKGKIKIHQTRDDSTGKGFIKGGIIGVVFAALFGPVGWIAMGAAAGGLFASFDRGIKNKLLKELGQNMTPSESAIAILVEHAHWETAFARMKTHGYGGQLVVSEIVPGDVEAVEKLLEDPKTVEAVPEELEIAAPAPVEAAPAPAPEPVAAAPDDLTQLSGVGPKAASALAAAGITTYAAVAEANEPELRRALHEADMTPPSNVATWPMQASYAAKGDWQGLMKHNQKGGPAKAKAAKPKAAAAASDDLTQISGIGPRIASILSAGGVTSYAQLEHKSAEELRGIIASGGALPPASLDTWPTQATYAVKGDWEGLASYNARHR
jgi:predicted flap endonuclease-1-like 5' DNA nuclease